MRKIKKLFKRLKLYFRFKKEGLSKDLRYTEYVLYGVMGFEEYQKYFDKKVMKGGRINMGYYKIDEKLLDKQFEFKIGSRHYGQMYYGINKMLLQLQFNVTSIGFYYWITAIQQYRKNYYKYDNTIEKVYNDVAKIHNTTRTRVERAMRTAKATATEQIQKQFNYYNKLTNKTVLELLTRNALFIEKVDNHIPRID